MAGWRSVAFGIPEIRAALRCGRAEESGGRRNRGLLGHRSGDRGGSDHPVADWLALTSSPPALAIRLAGLVLVIAGQLPNIERRRIWARREGCSITVSVNPCASDIGQLPVRR
jgi:hypothetical protein